MKNRLNLTKSILYAENRGCIFDSIQIDFLDNNDLYY